MKSIYFATSKSGQHQSLIDRCIAHILSAFPDSEVTWSDDLDWPKLVAQQGGSLSSAFAFVVSAFDGIVVLERGAFVGRGLYDQLKFAAELKKPRWVIRPDGDSQFSIYAVDLVVVHDEKDWQYSYGKITVGRQL